MLSQTEFDHLMKLNKIFANDMIELGPPPIEWQKEIISLDSKDKFLLDHRRKSIEVQKYIFNKRYRQTVVLLRYCSMGKHTNPSGTDEKTFNGPHIHLYREGYDEKWAFPVSTLGIKEVDSLKEVLEKIMAYCNIKKSNNIKDSLF